MPRRSIDSLTVTRSFTPTPAVLQPPAALSEAAKQVFLGIVTQCDRDHFLPSDGPLLAQYSVAVALAERAEKELLQGEGAPNPKWLAAWEKGTRWTKWMPCSTARAKSQRKSEDYSTPVIDAAQWSDAV